MKNKKKKSADFETLAELGKDHHRAGRIAEAIAQYDVALKIRPHDANILHLLGVAQFQAGRAEEAIAAVCKALSIAVTDEYFFNLGRIFVALGRSADSIPAFRNALALTPNSAPTHLHFGAALTAVGAHGEAVKALQRAAQLEEHSHVGYFLLGSGLQTASAAERATAAFRAAAMLNPAYAEALVALSVHQIEKGDLGTAATTCRYGVIAKPTLTEGHLTLAQVYFTTKEFDKAAEACKRAVALSPDSSVAHGNLATIIDELGHLGPAITHWRWALVLKPDMPQALYQFVTQAKKFCMWQGLPEWEALLLDLVRRGQSGVSPWSMCMQRATPAEQLRCARQWGDGQLGAGSVPFPPRRPDPARTRIRLGYLSSDLRPHAVAFLMQEVIQRHDRSTFEVIAYSLSPVDGTAFQARLAGMFDRFVDVSAMPDPRIAEMIRRDEVDILVDLNGYTHGARTRVLAMKPAPIQVNFLGFAGTMGADFIDYIVADRFLIPPESERFYAEKIAFLPSYQPNSTRDISPVAFARSTFNLPEQGFVFASFNNTYKINAEFFDIWMRLLRKVPGSVLWLKHANDEVLVNLRREAELRGVDPNRLVFAIGLARQEDHLARHACADLFLDTLPYNAHTTASDALWAGLPVVTCAGDTFAGRVAGSALTALGVPELITYSLEDYEALAYKLATDPEALATVRDKVRRLVHTSPLFDIAGYTRTLDAAYTAMWDTWRSGRAPQNLHIDGTAGAAPERTGPDAPPDALPAPAPPRSAGKRQKIGLIQTRGLGDVVIAAPIAQHYIDAGAQVFWPVDSRFYPSVQSAFPEIGFIPVDVEVNEPTSYEYFFARPLQLLLDAGCDPIFSLYSYLSGLDIVNPRLAQSLKFDEYKYAVTGVPFSRKWQLRITRDRAREAALVERLGIDRLDRPYVVVHEQGSGFRLDISLPADVLEKYAVVNIADLTPNPFDWLGVLEGASMFVGIDSCFANLVEQLDLCPQKFLFLRSSVQATPVFKNNWQFR